MNYFNQKQFLTDLYNYCTENNITFKDMSVDEIKYHIRKMCKLIAHGSHIKK